MPRPAFKEVEASRPDFDDGYKPHYTKTPQPNWKPGGGLNTLPSSDKFRDQSQWRSIDPKEHAQPSLYKLMISAIVPRPIAFLSSMDAQGVCNLSPFSYFNMCSANPPTIMVSIAANAKSEDGLKDSSSNIKALQEFCISMISEAFIEAANITGTDVPRGVEEWDLSGLTKRQSTTVKPPHVAESAFSMECRLVHWYELRNDDGKLISTVILGRITQFHGKEFVFDPEDPMRVMSEELRPVSRLGGVTYGRTLQMTELLRPSWEEVKGAANGSAVDNKA